MDAGTVKLRLIESRRPQTAITIRVQSPTVEAALDFLLGRGARLLHAAARTPEQQIVGAVQDPDGNTLHIWRELSEDEYDFVPALPKQLAWRPEAEALLKSLLKSEPALFRMLARQKVVAMSEPLAAATSRPGFDYGFGAGAPAPTGR